MRKDKHYTIKGHKKYKAITLHPAVRGWEIWFDGKVAYNENTFSLSEALEHVETWRKQYSVVEVGGEGAQGVKK